MENATHNISNKNTIGYEETDLLLRPYYNPQKTKNKQTYFVVAEKTYISHKKGNTKITNRNLDVAISGEGYFKLLTPKGYRYTLNGNMLTNNEGMLVDYNGNFYLDQTNQPIAIPENIQLHINDNGVIVNSRDQDEIGQIGVFIIPDKSFLIKEGENLYLSKVGDIVAEDDQYNLVSGALRISNVDEVQNIARFTEMSDSIRATNTIISDYFKMEKDAIDKITR